MILDIYKFLLYLQEYDNNFPNYFSITAQSENEINYISHYPNPNTIILPKCYQLINPGFFIYNIEHLIEWYNSMDHEEQLYYARIWEGLGLDVFISTPWRNVDFAVDMVAAATQIEFASLPGIYYK